MLNGTYTNQSGLPCRCSVLEGVEGPWQNAKLRSGQFQDEHVFPWTISSDRLEIHSDSETLDLADARIQQA
jgi:hypothetical protein